jgi:hypothetical protein
MNLKNVLFVAAGLLLLLMSLLISPSDRAANGSPQPGRRVVETSQNPAGTPVRPQQTQAPSDPLAGTRSDPTERTQDSPAATVGDGWKLLLYLLPILGLTVLAIRGLKAVYQRAGAMPDFRKGILGGLNLANARNSNRGSIRVIESVPLGSMGLHLVEVRGRQLLIGSTGTALCKLAEFTESDAVEDAGFQSLLDSASADAMKEEDGSVTTMMNSLREARESILRSAVRMRQGREGNSKDAA